MSHGAGSGVQKFNAKQMRSASGTQWRHPFFYQLHYFQRVYRQSYVATNEDFFPPKDFGTTNKCMVLTAAFSMIFQALQTEVETGNHNFRTKLYTNNTHNRAGWCGCDSLQLYLKNASFESPRVVNYQGWSFPWYFSGPLYKKGNSTSIWPQPLSFYALSINQPSAELLTAS